MVTKEISAIDGHFERVRGELLTAQSKNAVDWMRASRAAKSEQAVFIVGVPRSGTSILYKTLQTLPEFTLGGEAGKADLTEAQIFSGLLVGRRATTPIDDSNSRIFSYFLRDEEVWAMFCASVGQLRSWQENWLKLLSRSSHAIQLLEQSGQRGGYLWRLSFDPHVLRCFFYYAKQARKTARIVEKTPGNILYLPKIWATFPRAKIIAVVRHPVDVYASLRKRLERELAAGRSRSEVAWLTQSPAEFCDMYRRMVAVIKPYWRESRGAVHVLKYEALTGDKGAELTRVFEFIGSSKAKHHFDEDASEFSGHRKDVVKSNPLLTQPIQARASQWRDYVAVKSGKEIEKTLSAEMEWLEYGSISD